MGSFNILSLDGGGIRGVVTAIWLQELQRQNPDFLEGVDLIAGTSMGAANAAALASGMSLQDIVRIYTQDGPKLFAKRYSPRGFEGKALRFLSRLPGFHWLYDAENLVNPKWQISGLEHELEHYFHDGTMADLKKNVVFLTTKLFSSLPSQGKSRGIVKPVVLHNLEGSEYLDVPVKECVLRSMAAPVFFPSHNGYVDGGLFASNPTIAAIGAAISLHGVSLEDINLLSISTGISADGIANDGSLEWGLLQWGKHFPDVSTTALEEFDSEQAQAILGDRFCRLTAVLDADYPLDDYRKVDALIEFAERESSSERFTQASNFVKRFIKDE